MKRGYGISEWYSTSPEPGWMPTVELDGSFEVMRFSTASRFNAALPNLARGRHRQWTGSSLSSTYSKLQASKLTCCMVFIIISLVSLLFTRAWKYMTLPKKLQHVTFGEDFNWSQEKATLPGPALCKPWLLAICLTRAWEFRWSFQPEHGRGGDLAKRLKDIGFWRGISPEPAACVFFTKPSWAFDT